VTTRTDSILSGRKVIANLEAGERPINIVTGMPISDEFAQHITSLVSHQTVNDIAVIQRNLSLYPDAGQYTRPDVLQPGVEAKYVSQLATEPPQPVVEPIFGEKNKLAIAQSRQAASTADISKEIVVDRTGWIDRGRNTIANFEAGIFPTDMITGKPRSKESTQKLVDMMSRQIVRDIGIIQNTLRISPDAAQYTRPDVLQPGVEAKYVSQLEPEPLQPVVEPIFGKKGAEQSALSDPSSASFKEAMADHMVWIDRLAKTLEQLNAAAAKNASQFTPLGLYDDPLRHLQVYSTALSLINKAATPANGQTK
jgi:hypothetical protein